MSDSRTVRPHVDPTAIIVALITLFGVIYTAR